VYESPVAKSEHSPLARALPAASSPPTGAELPQARRSAADNTATPNRFGYTTAGGYSTPFGRRASASASKIPQLRHSFDGSLTPTAQSASTTPRTRAGSASPAQRKPRPPLLSANSKRIAPASPETTAAWPEKLVGQTPAPAMHSSQHAQPSSQQRARSAGAEHAAAQSEDDAWTSGQEDAEADAHAPGRGSVHAAAASFEESWLPSPVATPQQVCRSMQVFKRFQPPPTPCPCSGTEKPCAPCLTNGKRRNLWAPRGGIRGVDVYSR